MPPPKIGLLGGSFNPAHAGHVYISKQAIKLLGLDEIWWLVSPQNPLKEKQGMAEFENRLAIARQVAENCPQIKVSDFEINSGTTYTYDTMLALKAEYPKNNFVWLMGADNLLQFPKWHKWQDIMEIMPIAVFNRGDLKEKALTGEVAAKFAAYKINDAKQLNYTNPPAWTFLDIEIHPASATKIRNDSSTQDGFEK